VWVAFKQEQIKSVNNRGTFDSNDARILREEPKPFPKVAGKESLISKLVDTDGLTSDVEAIRKAVGNPIKTLGALANGGMAEMGRSVFYSMDSRLRTFAKIYNAPSIDKLADMF